MTDESYVCTKCGETAADYDGFWDAPGYDAGWNEYHSECPECGAMDTMEEQ